MTAGIDSVLKGSRILPVVDSHGGSQAGAAVR